MRGALAAGSIWRMDLEYFRITIRKPTSARAARHGLTPQLSARPRTSATQARLRIFKIFPVRLEEIARAKDHSKTSETRYKSLVRYEGSHRPNNKHPRRWRARTPPSAPLDQRTASTYIVGRIPKLGKGRP